MGLEGIGFERGCFVYVLFCFVLFCFVLFCFVLFCFVLFCFVSFVFLSFLPRNILRTSIQNIINLFIRIISKTLSIYSNFFEKGGNGRLILIAFFLELFNLGRRDLFELFDGDLGGRMRGGLVSKKKKGGGRER